VHRQKKAADCRAQSATEIAKDNVLLAATTFASVTCKIAIHEILIVPVKSLARAWGIDI